MSGGAVDWRDLPLITAQILRGLVRALGLRASSRAETLELPPCVLPPRLDAVTSAWILRWIRLLVGVLIFWRRQRCFYRAYVTAYVLRQWGIPLELNFGYKNLFGTGKKEAHCWLTREGNLYDEPESTTRFYPLFLGERPGLVRYWAGGETGNVSPRHRKTLAAFGRWTRQSPIDSPGRRRHHADGKRRHHLEDPGQRYRGAEPEDG